MAAGVAVIALLVSPSPQATAVSVDGDDAAETIVGRGGLILPSQVDEATRAQVASCPDCLWRMASPCAAAPLGNAFDGSPTCLSVTRGCTGGSLRRTWFREGQAPWQDVGLVCLRDDPVTVEEIGARVGERLVVSPRFHRLHHGVLSIGASGKNYAVLLPVWDWVFGTADFDRARYPRTGDPTAPESLASGGWMRQQVDGTKRMLRALAGRDG